MVYAQIAVGSLNHIALQLGGAARCPTDIICAKSMDACNRPSGSVSDALCDNVWGEAESTEDGAVTAVGVLDDQQPLEWQAYPIQLPPLIDNDAFVLQTLSHISGSA